MKIQTTVRRLQFTCLFVASILLIFPFFQTPFALQEVSAQTTYQKQPVGQYGTITYEHYRLHETLDGEKIQQTSDKSYLNQTFWIKDSYQKGIEMYYSLENSQGETIGLIQSSSVVLTNDQAEGHKQAIVATKEITTSDLSIFSNFLWQKKDVTDAFVGQKVRLKGAYHHFNGKVYYDTYDLNNKWLGFLSEEAFNEVSETDQSLVNEEIIEEEQEEVIETTETTKQSSQEEVVNEDTVQESTVDVQEQELPVLPMSSYLLGGQIASARVRRIEDHTSLAQPRNFYAATYKNKNEFVEKIAKDAQEVANQYGLYPSVMIAQAILESAYGESQLTKEANNFFGIKFTVGADEGRFGRYDIHSDEFVNGKRVSLAASFRKYPTAKASLEDNGKLLAQGLSWNRTFYQASWRKNAATYKEATKGLTGKYATDPLYDSKLNQLIENWNLSQYD
ncbi:glucosaminidase domain-containing protein [Enterococcus sp.]|uniref:glucosaminidase domain-containing protein n=1 Tax=Enterococcus sp. TaxID=35783 RepID=UPI002FC929DD